MPSLYQLYEKVPNPRIAFHAIFFALFAFFIVSCYNKIDGIKKTEKTNQRTYFSFSPGISRHAAKSALTGNDR